MHQNSPQRNNYFDKWAQSVDKKLEAIDLKLDDFRKDAIITHSNCRAEGERIWNEVRRIESEHGQRLASHHTELIIWRGVLGLMGATLIISILNLVVMKNIGTTSNGTSVSTTSTSEQSYHERPHYVPYHYAPATSSTPNVLGKP